MLLDKHEGGDTVPFAGGVSALQFTTAICNLRKKNISFIGHFEIEIETRPMLCRIALLDCLFSFFFYCEVAQETGSKIVRKAVPQCNFTHHRCSLIARFQNGRRSFTLLRRQKRAHRKSIAVNRFAAVQSICECSVVK